MPTGRPQGETHAGAAYVFRGPAQQAEVGSAVKKLSAVGCQWSEKAIPPIAQARVSALPAWSHGKLVGKGATGKPRRLSIHLQVWSCRAARSGLRSRTSWSRRTVLPE